MPTAGFGLPVFFTGVGLRITKRKGPAGPPCRLRQAGLSVIPWVMNDMDKSLASAFAKAITAMCVRNTFLEDLHAGTCPSSKTGDTPT